jgi:hypothetical protein|tara:strand:- start:970 stop:1140 length:171 start_codon:yes stop_codon:yes gene_type:complete
MKEAMVKINVRLPAYVVEHFRQHDNYTGAVRTVLKDYVDAMRVPVVIEGETYEADE